MDGWTDISQHQIYLFKNIYQVNHQEHKLTARLMDQKTYKIQNNYTKSNYTFRYIGGAALQ